MALRLLPPVLDLRKMALTIMFWNARSLTRKTCELKKYIQETSPLVIGICETWLSAHISLKLPGYNIYRKDRPTKRGGGVLLAIKNTLNFSPLEIPSWQNGHLEFAAVRLKTKNSWVTIAICYNPGGKTSIQEYEHCFSTLPSPILTMGDFNAHHSLWDPEIHFKQQSLSG